jgi:DNA-directed RNA polymerase specialized sigma24 family protein
MTQVEISTDTLEQQCQQAVERLIARYQCYLLEPIEFTRRTVEYMQTGGANSPSKAAIGIYSLALYHACSGSEGLDRQDRGYRELHRYLYDVASWRYPEVCDDATQAALVRIFTEFARCRVPIAFLMFAFRELMNAVRILRRQTGHYARSLEHAMGDGEETLITLLVDPLQPDPLLVAIEQETMEQLYQLVAEFRRKHPRAINQIAALVMKYLRGMDDLAISEALNVSVKSVHELRSRARQRLRSDPHWQAFAQASGLLDDVSET